jgi:hypothetical protein
MIELNAYKNLNTASKTYGQWYVRKESKQVYGLSELAQHMSEHNTPFSKGTIQGILTDMVKCIRELALNGITIKIPDLALFSCSVESSPAANPGKLKAALVENGGQVKNVKLLAQSTGEFTRSELNKDARFKFTSLTQSVIDEWNEEHGTDPEPEP